MLKYDRIEVPKGTDVNKTNASCEFIIRQQWCFLDINFKSQPEIFNVMI